MDKNPEEAHLLHGNGGVHPPAYSSVNKNDETKRRIRDLDDEHRATYCCCLVFSAIMMILMIAQFAMVLKIREYNSPITGYPYVTTYNKTIAKENPGIKDAGYHFGPPKNILDHPKPNCTYSRWHGGSFIPYGYVSAKGDSWCARGLGCYSYVEKCGRWKEFNHHFTVAFYINIFLLFSLTCLLMILSIRTYHVIRKGGRSRI